MCSQHRDVGWGRAGDEQIVGHAEGMTTGGRRWGAKAADDAGKQPLRASIGSTRVHLVRSRELFRNTSGFAAEY